MRTIIFLPPLNLQLYSGIWGNREYFACLSGVVAECTIASTFSPCVKVVHVYTYEVVLYVTSDMRLWIVQHQEYGLVATVENLLGLSSSLLPTNLQLFRACMTDLRYVDVVRLVVLFSIPYRSDSCLQICVTIAIR